MKRVITIMFFLLCLTSCSKNIYHLSDAIPDLNTCDLAINNGQSCIYYWRDYNGEIITAVYYFKYNDWNLYITRAINK